MQTRQITSLDEPELKDFVQLTDVALRRSLEPASGLYLAESTKVIARAIAAGHRPRAVLTIHRWLPDLEPLLASFPEVTVYVGSDTQLETLTGFHLHRGAIASMHRPYLLSVSETINEAKLVVVLDGLVDHTNAGAAFRSAVALGAEAVLITPSCADPLYRRSVRVSMGAVLELPWTRLSALEAGGADELHGCGFRIAALAPRATAIPLNEYVRHVPERLALVLGTEGDGLPPTVLAVCDDTVMIPMMHGVDSLNVAAACAVAVYAVATGRGALEDSH